MISQNPKGDKQAEIRHQDQLTVSKGTQEITVPDLTGKTAEEAQKALTVSGLKYAKGAAEYLTPSRKTTWRQDIAAGTAVAKDTVVTYYLSLGLRGHRGSQRGANEGAATTTLNNAGFYVNADYAPSGHGGAFQPVISQSTCRRASCSRTASG